MPDRPIVAQRKRLKPDALYLGDNGRCFCGDHAGTTAAYTGRDLSGQEVLHLTRAVVVAGGFGDSIDAYTCEECGRGVRA